jgi:hypothetical protein
MTTSSEAEAAAVSEAGQSPASRRQITRASASTTFGSKWVPAQRRSSATSAGRAFRYGRSVVIALNASQQNSIGGSAGAARTDSFLSAEVTDELSRGYNAAALALVAELVDAQG